jgi:hypothetical protein
MMMKVLTTALIFAFRIVNGNASIVCTNGIKAFNVIDTSISPSIAIDLTSTVDLSDSPTCSFNIEASLADVSEGCETAAVKCVKFFLDGMEVQSADSAPFTYTHDVGGTYTLKACTYSDVACTMDESGCNEMEVEFLACDRPNQGTSTTTSMERRAQACTPSQVTSFDLVDTESPYFPVITPFIPPIIDLLDFPTCAINMYAVVTEGTCGPPACVKLTLGGQVRKELFVPYALYGNTGRFIRSGKPDLGAQTLTACTYTDTKCTKGMAGCLSVDVFVKDCIAMSM